MTSAQNGAVLVGLDVHSIQSYLFATSKLKEVVGASRIIDDFTGAQPNDAPALVLGRMELKRSDAGSPSGQAWYVPVRLGGGVVRLLLPSESLAREFVRGMSEWALQYATGLEFDAAHVPFELRSTNFADANKILIHRINAQRQVGSGGHAFNGFPFTAPCSLTGDPAEAYGGRNERLCAASIDKRSYQTRHDDRWATVRDQSILQAFKVDDPRRPFILDLESMRDDDPSDSYMAVVAIDLNSLGEASKRAIGQATGIDALHLVRGFVERVSAATGSGFSAALNALASNPDSSHEFRTIERVVGRCGKLPLRPLVFGGDDLTFVMHASLAPRFAACLAEELFKAGYASGVGIAFVKTKSPLMRAIELAESLLARAKRAGRDRTYVDLMLCSSEIAPDASGRDASGERPPRGPYTLEAFRELLSHATLLKHELPSSHVRGAVDGFQQGLEPGRALLRDLVENIDRGLGGGLRASAASRALLMRFIEEAPVAATYLDCIDLFRFIAPRPDLSDSLPSKSEGTEVHA